MSYEPTSSTLRRKQEEAAAAVIQKAYRKFLLKLKDAKQKAPEIVSDESGSSQPDGASALASPH